MTSNVHPIFANLAGKKCWFSYDFLTTNEIDSGKFQYLVDREIIAAATTNPTSNRAVWKQNVETDGGKWRDRVKEMLPHMTPEKVARTLFVSGIIAPAAQALELVSRNTKFVNGDISYEISPKFARTKDPDDKATFKSESQHALAEILRLDSSLSQAIKPHNFFVKLHGTNTGFNSAQTAIARGTNINFTLLSRLNHIRDAMNAHKEGNYNPEEHTLIQTGPYSKAVFSIFISRTDREIDPLLSDVLKLLAHIERRLKLGNGVFGGPKDEIDRGFLAHLRKKYELYKLHYQDSICADFLKSIAPLKMQAGPAYIKAIIYPAFKREYVEDSKWQRFMHDKGAIMPQIYLASTGRKDAAGKYTTDPHYIKPLKGEWTTNTAPPEVISLLAETNPEDMPFDDSLTMEKDVSEALIVLSELEDLGIDIELILQDVQDKGLDAFTKDDAAVTEDITRTARTLNV